MKSIVDDPGDTGVYETLTCCHEVERVTDFVAVPLSVEPAYSRRRRFNGFPPLSARTQRLAV